MNRIREAISQNTDLPEGKYWAASRSGESRIDLRFSDGSRTSVQYHSIQKFEFFPESSNEDEELIVLDITGVSRFEIFGTNLLPIYEALNRSAVRFIAMVNRTSDAADSDGVRVSLIREFTAEEIEESKAREKGRVRKSLEDYLNTLSKEEDDRVWNQALQEAKEAGLALSSDEEKWAAMTDWFRRQN